MMQADTESHYSTRMAAAVYSALPTNRLPTVLKEESDSTAGPALPHQPRTLGQAGELSPVETGIAPAVGSQFFRHVPPRVTTIRLQLCTLARVQESAKQRVCLAGLSMQCQWLAAYARMANFHALSQVAAAMEALTREMYHSGLLNESLLRSMALAADLLNTLARTPPGKVGRTEGARVVVVDEPCKPREELLSTLETFQISGVGIAEPAAAIEHVKSSHVDLIVLRAGTDERDAVEFCQTIRHVSGHGKTPILVLASETSWESRAALAISGASEVLGEDCICAALALKTVAHLFRSRLNSSDE